MPQQRSLIVSCSALVFVGLVVSLVIALVGCEAEPEPEPQIFDPDQVIAEAVDYEANFERLDLEGIITKHDDSGNTTARIWANKLGADMFRTIDVTDPTQTLEMPRGAVFVKESDNSQGNPINAMQVLAKFEDGYNPTFDDWFFALVRRDGTPIDGRIGNGAEVFFCADCHNSMGGMTDLVIGLPADQLAP